MTDYYY